MLDIETKQRFKRAISKSVNPFVSDNRTILTILNYHSIHPDLPFSTSPSEFSRQMEYLADNFAMSSLSKVYEMRVELKPLQERTAVVTFDDGYEDNYLHAFPILARLGIKATIFVTTGFVNGEVDIAQRDKTYADLKALSWEQIFEMKKWGILFGSHTHTHPILSKIPLNEARNEIAHSKKVLEDVIGAPVEHFAYPLGQPNTFNSSIIEILKETGFKLACSALWGNDNKDIGLYKLRRIRIDACDTFDDFKEKVKGNWEFMRWGQVVKGFFTYA
ncbi:MAG: polysaccharide deacetylase family protein [Nitrospinae bacterium]|nr:polysaccharide deacetylase family protein [Nitrospinota bacterium]